MTSSIAGTFLHGELWGDGNGSAELVGTSFVAGPWIKTGPQSLILMSIIIEGTIPNNLDVQIEWTMDRIISMLVDAQVYDGDGVFLVDENIYRIQGDLSAPRSLRVNLPKHTFHRIKVRRISGDATTAAYVEGRARPPFHTTKKGASGGALSSHASSHISGGIDQIDGDQIDIDFSPTNYSQDTSPVEVSTSEHLTAHLAGIDAELAGGSHFVAANCLSGDAEGALVAISGDAIGGVIQVTTADPYNNSKIPAVGVIISKSTSTDCIVQLAGQITVLTGLSPGKLHWLNSGGTATVTTPSGPGVRYAHGVGIALASNVLFWRPQDVFTLN